MKSGKKNDFDGKVSSLTEKIGVSVIGLLTILGVGLIIYTGIKATTYTPQTSDKEYLTLEDTEVNPNENQEASDQPTSTETESPKVDENVTNQPESDVLETPESPETNVTEEPEQPEQPEQPETLEAVCNIDGVNVRQEPQTGTTIIGNLIAGDKVTVLNRYFSDEWVQVSFEGQTGYVYHEYLDFE